MKQVNLANVERALRRVFLSTTVLSRIVIVSKAAATNIVALVYVLNRYIHIAKEKQVKLFKKMRALEGRRSSYIHKLSIRPWRSP